MDYVVVLEHYTVYYQNFLHFQELNPYLQHMSNIASVEYNNFFHGLTSPVVLCLLIIEFSRSHSRDITHSRTPLGK